MPSLRLAVLLSGRGSNFAAIRDAIVGGALDAEIVCVISNRTGAAGIVAAQQAGLQAFIIDHRTFASRAAHEAVVVETLARFRPDYVILAGYMRLLSTDFVARFPQRIVNIHPSLLPAFPGVDAQGQALRHGVKISGCTVHFVDEHLDSGPILVQRAVPVLDGDTVDDLSARILEQEHVAYVEALQRLATGKWRVEGRRVVFE